MDVHDEALDTLKNIPDEAWEKMATPILKENQVKIINSMLHEQNITSQDTKSSLMKVILDAMKKTKFESDRDDTSLSQRASDVAIGAIQGLLRTGENQKAEFRSTDSRLGKIEEQLNNVNKSLESMGEVTMLSKGLTAIGGLANGIRKWQFAVNEDGSINAKKFFSGMLDIVNGVAVLLPPPVSQITGSITSIYNLFTNGGSPTQKEIMENLFAEQAKMIKEEFAKQNEAIKVMLDASELQSIETKAMGVLDAIASREEFISAYDGLDTCLSDVVAAEITERVNYFTDQAEVYTIRHVFDKKCQMLAKKSTPSDEELPQLKVCAMLLYTEMVIEKRKRHTLSRMIGLLSNSKSHYQLSDGYLRVENKERKALSNWLESSVLKEDVFCGLFNYNMSVWDFLYDDSLPRSLTLSLMATFTDEDKVARINCIDKGTIIFYYFIKS